MEFTAEQIKWVRKLARRNSLDVGVFGSPMTIRKTATFPVSVVDCYIPEHEFAHTLEIVSREYTHRYIHLVVGERSSEMGKDVMVNPIFVVSINTDIPV